MADFVKLTNISDVEQGKMKSFEIEYEKILLCNIDGEFFAVSNECSHDSAPISDGHLDGDQIVCPRHGARFCLKNGEVKAPPAVAPISTYELKIVNDEILIKLD